VYQCEHEHDQGWDTAWSGVLLHTENAPGVGMSAVMKVMKVIKVMKGIPLHLFTDPHRLSGGCV